MTDRPAIVPESPEVQPLEMMGVRFNLVTTPTMLDIVERVIEADERCVFAGHNVHSVYLYHSDPKMRAFYAAAPYIFLDGMPLVWIARWLGYPAERQHRHAPIDWMPLLLERASQKGWRVFFLGSEPRVEKVGAERLRERFPNLQLRTRDGFFDATPGSPEAEAVLEEIRAFQPHLLCVCMGMPRQEHWTVDFYDRLNANVTFNLGALLDLFAGELPVPPRWIGQVGFEWLYRLVSHPRRVWRRYLIEPWFLLPHLARDLISSPRRGAAPAADRGD
jgi:N-acetylglucosaminyldiphosphoundecaprenol N-acetyl-beta-D-mannosaminyltransferase